MGIVMRMPKRNLYVPDRHEPLWERAETVAAGQGLSLSEFVADAIRWHLEATEAGSQPTVGQRLNDLERHAHQMQEQIGEIASHLDLRK